MSMQGGAYASSLWAACRTFLKLLSWPQSQHLVQDEELFPSHRMSEQPPSTWVSLPLGAIGVLIKDVHR